MKDFNKHINFCLEVLDSLDIPYSSCINFEINNRAKRRWGQTELKHNSDFISYKIMDGFRTTITKHNVDVYTISVSSLLLDDSTSDKGLEQVILHELLHTCPNCMNHKEPWLKLANKVNKAYGYNIKRTDNATTLGCNIKVEHKYEVRCTKCHHSWFYDRMCGAVEYPQTYRCNTCKAPLERMK